MEPQPPEDWGGRATPTVHSASPPTPCIGQSWRSLHPTTAPCSRQQVTTGSPSDFQLSSWEAHQGSYLSSHQKHPAFEGLQCTPALGNASNATSASTHNVMARERFLYDNARTARNSSLMPVSTDFGNKGHLCLSHQSLPFYIIPGFQILAHKKF